MIRTPGRIITIPSLELRQGVRLAVMSASSPAERAQILHLLLREMVDAMTLSTTARGEAVNVVDINDAAVMPLSSQPLAPTGTGTDSHRGRHEFAENVWDTSGLSERSTALSVNHVEAGRNC